MTAFIRHYLAFRTGTLCNEQNVYERFRDRIEKELSETDAFMSELTTLGKFADYYNRLLRPEAEPDADIRAALRRLNTLEIVTAYPFLLGLYDALACGETERDAVIESLRVLEGYIVRRFLTGEPTNSLNKMFPTLWRDIDASQMVGSLKHALVGRNYPTDARVQRAVLEEQFDRRSQTREKLVLILETVNRYLSVKSGAYTVLDGKPTIEHIMPQTLSVAWKADLGSDWEETYRDYLNALGNLTLVTQEWNSTLSNTPFGVKKPKLCVHGLRLNSEYFGRNIKAWNADAIRARSHFLANTILAVWPAAGEPLVKDQSTNNPVPRSLVLLGERVPVQSWRDVTFHTARLLSQIVDDFDSLASSSRIISGKRNSSQPADCCPMGGGST